MLLDATAGNRKMWMGRNPCIPYVVFMDREKELRVPPDVLCDHRAMPFRDNCFELIIYDPPFMARRNPPRYWNDPKEIIFKNKRGFTASGSWWGLPKTKRELLSTIHQAQLEFQRLSSKLCLKWTEVDYTLWKILPFFKDWIETYRQGFKQERTKKGTMGSIRASDDKYCKTWWILFRTKTIICAEGKENEEP